MIPNRLLLLLPGDDPGLVFQGGATIVGRWSDVLTLATTPAAKLKIQATPREAVKVEIQK